MHTRTAIATSITALVALGLAGCGAPTVPASPAPGATSPAQPSHSEQGHDDHSHEPSATHAEGTETTERSPRVVVATETGMTVLDHALKPLGTFATTSRPTLTVAHDNRHVVAVQGEAGVVNLLDAGSWAKGHGDHFHFFVAEPKLGEQPLTGKKPVHVVPNAKADATAVFFDDDGAAVLLDDHALESGHVDEAPKVTTKGAQHGLVMPLPDSRRLVTQPGKEGSLPDTIELQDASGAVLDTFTCTGMHGEDVVGSVAAFGCLDSVLVIADGKATRVAAPDSSKERVGGLVANADASTFVGDWGPTSLVFITGGKAKLVDIGVTYGNRVATPDGRFAVLGTDGALRLFDTGGKQLQKLAVTKPWQLPKGHGGTVPSIAAGEVAAANTVWVSEPATHQVHAVDLFANQVKSASVPGQPSSIAVTNAS